MALESSTFSSLIQSRDGYIWASSQNGIVRFDGLRFATLREDNTPGLKRGYSLALAEDAQGALWAGTYGGGVSRIIHDRATTYTTKDGLMHDTVFSLCEDREGGIWIGFSGGVQRFYKGKFETYPSERLGAIGTAHAMARDPSGSIWIFIGKSMIRIDAGQITRYPIEAWAAPGSKQILIDHAGTVWVATHAGLYQLVENQFQRYGPASLAKEAISSIVEDREHVLWLGTASGLKRLINGKIETFTAQDGLSGNTVRALLADRNGDIWAASTGLDYFKSRLATTFSKKHGLASEMVWSAFDDAQGTSWIATDGGLTRLRGGAARTYTTQDGLRSNVVYCATVDRRGTVWFGGDGWAGSLRHGELPIQILSIDMPDERIYSVFETSADELLFGCGHGLRRLAANKLELLPEHLPGVNSLFEASGGHLWLSTRQQLFDFSSGHLAKYGGDKDDYTSVSVDSSGTVWATSMFGGLARIKNGTLRQLAGAAEHLRRPLNAALEDDLGNLWITSSHDLLRISKRELNEYADGSRHDVFVSVFDGADGLPSGEFSGGVQNAGWKRQDGKFWLPTTKGLVLFDPASVHTEGPLPTYIESVLVDEKPISREGKQILSPGHQRMQFDFTAIDFHNPGQVLFRYKLEGFDSQWMPAGARRTAVYTGLRYGSYRFRVGARNRDGVWNEASSFSFRIAPFVYETPSFYTLCSLMAWFLLVAVYKWRVAQVKAGLERMHEERMAERSRIAIEVHDTLLQGVAGAAMMLQSIRKKIENTEVRARIDNVVHEIQQSMANTRRALWEIQSTEGGDDLASLESYARGLTTALNIRFSFTQISKPPQMAPELRTDLLRVGKEAVLNAAKHSQGTEITVALEFTDAEINLTVEDDGTGIPSMESPPAGHWGLAAMRERVQRWGGSLMLSNREGGGTTVRVVVPRGRG